MKDYGISVLTQYEMEVYGTHRIRGAVLCNTDKGLFLLKETHMEEGRLIMLTGLYEQLNENKFWRVDTPFSNKEGLYISIAEDGTGYMLKRWFDGRECDVRRENELIEGAGCLARLHACMRKERNEEIHLEENPLIKEYVRHNRELRKVREFVCRRSVKSPFEIVFLKGYDKMYRWAELGLAEMENAGLIGLFEKAETEQQMVHGDYNYHNLLICQEGMAVTGFEHAHRGLQLEDFYYFMRKCMEKHHYDELLGYRMLRAYDAENPLGKKERQYLAIRMAYPEKFWKIVNSYYHSGKAWIPAKNVEKLSLSIEQTEEKKRFLKNIFGFPK